MERLEVLRLEGRRSVIPGVNRQPMVLPSDVYRKKGLGEYRDKPGPAREVPISYLYLRALGTNGLEGWYGPIEEEAGFTIDRSLVKLVVGKDVLAFSRLWDEMYLGRGLTRSGYAVMAAISAVDNVLWDLRGKYYEAPVCTLLGGPTRPGVEVYASCKNYSQHPEDMRVSVAGLKRSGFRRFKYHFSYGPAQGREGLQKNVELVRDLRQTAGEDCEIMFDAFGSWDLPYATSWAKRAEPFAPGFVEECFPRDRLDDYVRLRQSTSIPVATGEHLYGRQDALMYLKAGALDILQCDPEWCGGVSEFVRIAHMAAPYGVQVVPHGQNLHAALHGAASQPPGVCPMMEYLVSYMEYRHFFETAPPRPTEGKIAPSEAPGFGIELDASRIDRQTVMSWR